MIRAQVITVGASYEAQVSLLTRLGTHGGIEVIDAIGGGLSDVSVILVGPDWAGSSPELTHRVVTLCRLARHSDATIFIVRERGDDWYMQMHGVSSPLDKELCWFVAAPLDSPRLAERIVEAARKQSATSGASVAALRAASAELQGAADRVANARWRLEAKPESDVEKQSDRIAALHGLEAMLRVQATECDDAAAHRRIELAIDDLGDKVEMPAHVAEDVDRAIREALGE